jgi:universal stress protein A
MNTQTGTPETPDASLLETRNEILSASDKLTSMFELKRILAPTDFSDRAEKAVCYAVSFAKQFGATLYLLHVVPVIPMGGEFGAMEYPMPLVEMNEASERQLASFKERIVGNQVRCELLVRTGHVMSEIVSAASELNIDLLVIATHGFTGLKHVLLGSTAENVIRHAPCPVLTVREREHDFLKTANA